MALAADANMAERQLLCLEQTLNIAKYRTFRAGTQIHSPKGNGGFS